VRKDNQIAGASHKSDGASVIKLADKTSNLLVIAKRPPPWPKDQKRAYVDWARGRRIGSAVQAGGADGRFRGGGKIGDGKHRAARLTGKRRADGLV
jgi:hypothetical protein